MRLDLGDGFVLRHAERSDHAALNHVCLLTGDSGAMLRHARTTPTCSG